MPGVYFWAAPGLPHRPPPDSRPPVRTTIMLTGGALFKRPLPAPALALHSLLLTYIGRGTTQARLGLPARTYAVHRHQEHTAGMGWYCPVRRASRAVTEQHPRYTPIARV